MFRKMIPERMAESTYTLDYEKEYANGIRGLIFDIDNTLVTHGAPADENAVRLFEELHRIGFKTLLLSNNDEERVRPFAEACGTPYLCDAHKPSKKAAEAALKLLGTGKEDTLLVGDQLLTDRLTASRYGIPCVTVRPISKKEPAQIVLKRWIEAPFIKAARRREQKKKSAT